MRTVLVKSNALIIYTTAGQVNTFDYIICEKA